MLCLIAYIHYLGQRYNIFPNATQVSSDTLHSAPIGGGALVESILRRVASRATTQDHTAIPRTCEVQVRGIVHLLDSSGLSPCIRAEYLSNQVSA